MQALWLVMTSREIGNTAGFVVGSVAGTVANRDADSVAGRDRR
jgi:hypothetical protein